MTVETLYVADSFEQSLLERKEALRSSGLTPAANPQSDESLRSLLQSTNFLPPRTSDQQGWAMAMPLIDRIEGKDEDDEEEMMTPPLSPDASFQLASPPLLTPSSVASSFMPASALKRPQDETEPEPEVKKKKRVGFAV